ncbi:hypothetical protein BaRGS_00027298, partial [Batillaria attramentaria]
TPDNRTLPSTFYENGRFVLNVPNPVVGGEYTCVLDQASPATLCVSGDSPLQRGATFNVEGVNVQFALMDARLKAQQEKQAELAAQLQAQLAKNADMETRLTMLQTTEEALVRENARLKQLAESAAANASLLQTKLESSVPQVFFYATPNDPKDLRHAARGVLFDNVKNNAGGGYDNTTGNFTAPVSGLYLFMVTVSVDPTCTNTQCHAGVKLHVQGQSDAEVWALMGSSGSVEVTAHLTAGQHAWVTPVDRVELAQGSSSRYIGRLAKDPESSFSGVLIRLDF